jgi:hypothetical protein
MRLKRYRNPNKSKFHDSPFLSNLPKQQAIMDLGWRKLSIPGSWWIQRLRLGLQVCFSRFPVSLLDCLQPSFLHRVRPSRCQYLGITLARANVQLPFLHRLECPFLRNMRLARGEYDDYAFGWQKTLLSWLREWSTICGATSSVRMKV